MKKLLLLLLLCQYYFLFYVFFTFVGVNSVDMSTSSDGSGVSFNEEVNNGQFSLVSSLLQRGNDFSGDATHPTRDDCFVHKMTETSKNYEEGMKYYLISCIILHEDI